MVIQRRMEIGDALPGEMTIGGTHAAYTLERKSVAIPSGAYSVGLYPSPHFDRLMPIIQNVPGRQYILIHWGNYPENSDGCILVGEIEDPSTGDIFNTVKQWQALFPAIQAAVEGEGCSIAIYDALTNAEEVQDAAAGEG